MREVSSNFIKAEMFVGASNECISCGLGVNHNHVVMVTEAQVGKVTSKIHITWLYVFTCIMFRSGRTLQNCG